MIASLIEDKSYAWTDEDLGKLTSGNLLRVFREVEAVKIFLEYEEPYQDWIPKEDYNPEETDCMTRVE